MENIDSGGDNVYNGDETATLSERIFFVFMRANVESVETFRYW